MWLNNSNRELWNQRRCGYRYGGKFKSWRMLQFWGTNYWKDIRAFLKEQKTLGREIYPSTFKTIFRPLLECPFDKVKIVIVGQDPYYMKGVADGIPFSVLPNNNKIPRGTDNGKVRGIIVPTDKTIKIPGSLKSIFNEYREDLGFPHPRTGDLSTWLRNGILCINTVWTVEAGRPKSHYKIHNRQSWQELTAEIINRVSKLKDRVVFIFWGAVAKEHIHLVDKTKHLVLFGAHPTPRNVNLKSRDQIPFRGGKYFSKACEYLDINKNIWRLP